MAQEYTFRDIDSAHRLPKGAAFRAFKALHGSLSEGDDFVVLHHRLDAARIQVLRLQHRVYPSSINVVALSESGRAKVAAALRQV